MNASARQAAAGSLAALRALARDDNHRSLGFESLKDVETATLDEPLPVFMLRLDAMRSYRAGRRADPLLQPSGCTLFPVSVAGRVRMSIEVTVRDGRPRAGSFGAPGLAALIARQRDRSAPPGSDFVVHAAALGVYLVGHRGPGGTVVTPILDDGRAGFVAGQSMTLAQALEQLGAMARDGNGLPM